MSASQAGNIQFLDMRNTKNTYLTIDAHRGSLTALAIHRHAPIIASGSAKQLIKVFNLEGDPLGTIRYYPTFMAQKIGSVSCLTFHPYQVLLAAGAADACVSIYADDISPPRWTHLIRTGSKNWPNGLLFMKVQVGPLLKVYNILIKPPHSGHLWKVKDQHMLWRLWQIIFVVYRWRKV